MRTQPSTSQCKIDFPTSPLWFRTIRQLIYAATLQSGFSEREAGQIAMAVDEALGNIYRHGNACSTEGTISLHYATKIKPKPTINITIEDDATQVDIDLIKSRELSDIKPGGIGVHLIQSVMDDAAWTKRKDSGMKLSMSKTSTSTSMHPIESNKDTHG